VGTAFVPLAGIPVIRAHLDQRAAKRREIGTLDRAHSDILRASKERKKKEIFQDPLIPWILVPKDEKPRETD